MSNQNGIPASILHVHDEVADALSAGRAVVALESTIISHGFPYPQNAESARTCEQVIREEGAVPATIAVIDGVIRVGLTDDQIEFLATADDIVKCSRRDLAAVCAKKASGATTVAATMITAAMAGIRLFATGGIGGVHRGAQETFDISADLEEFARTPVAVVCAGPKSILDIPLTLEYLETAGIPVIGYGTDDLPAFYLRRSGLSVDYRMDTPEEVAALLRAQHDLALKSGVLIANPIPEDAALQLELIDPQIEQALQEAAAQGIHGKATTPFLLDRLYRATQGKSVEANRALVRNNCRVAAQIAVALC